MNAPFCFFAAGMNSQLTYIWEKATIEAKVIIVFLVIYLLLVSQRKLARYAQAVFHLHLVSHVIRDHLAAIERLN